LYRPAPPWRAPCRPPVQTGNGILNGKNPANPMILMASKLIPRDNVGDDEGWSAC
jgi:ribose transport system substrate-binding protein